MNLDMGREGVGHIVVPLVAEWVRPAIRIN
jgi:hypothetical protein